MTTMATRLDDTGRRRLVLAVAVEALNPGFRVRRPSVRDRAARVWSAWAIQSQWRPWHCWSITDRILVGAILGAAAAWCMLL